MAVYHCKNCDVEFTLETKEEACEQSEDGENCFSRDDMRVDNEEEWDICENRANHLIDVWVEGVWFGINTFASPNGDVQMRFWGMVPTQI